MAIPLARSWTSIGPWRIGAWSSPNSGGSRPVVLVHGFGVSGRYWHPLARRLARRHPVYVPELPGHGGSTRPPEALDVPGLREVLAAWMDAAGLARAALVANSLGCQIAADLAARDPGRVSALVLAGPTVDPAARSAPAQIARLALSAPVEHPGLYPIILRDYLRAGPRQLQAELRHMLRHRIEEHLPAVAAPTLVVRGTLDRIVPHRWAREAVRLLPRGRLVEIPLGGHAAHYTRAGAVARQVLAFLA